MAGRSGQQVGTARNGAIIAAFPELTRRLLGEAITHMQWVLAEDDDVMDLLFAGTGSLATASVFFDAIAERHAERMAELSLA